MHILVAFNNLNLILLAIENKLNKYQDDTKEDEQPLPDFSTFKDIASAFICLTSSITRYLKKADFTTLRRACILQIKTPNGAQLPPQVVEKISAAKNLDDLLDLLAISPYWSWIDLRLLQALVVASGSIKAGTLLSNYKQVVYSKKLIDVLPNDPSEQVKQEYYSKVVSKLDKDPEGDIIVADLLKFRSQLEVVIMDITEGTCVLDHFKSGCIEIHWYIPTHCTEHAYHAASLKLHKFHEYSLQHLKIGNYPLMCNPLAVGLLRIVSEFPLPDSAGKIIIYVTALCLYNIHQSQISVIQLMLSIHYYNR